MKPDPILKPCPLCGGPGEYKKHGYDGTMASGMELPDWSCGCSKCDLWFKKVSGSTWFPKRGTVSLEIEAKTMLADKWNRRGEEVP